MQINPSNIKENIENFIEYVREKSNKANLVAVSKYRTEDEIVEAIKAGQKLFGENKVQEAKLKWTKIKLECPDTKLHLIGPLQSNKCADAVAIFDVIEVVDRKKIIDAISKEIIKQNKQPKLLIQVNISNEVQKSGCNVDDLGDIIDYCKGKDLDISGLMCIPKADQDPSDDFKRLKNLCDHYNLQTCSMGMSSDYKIALECGSTQIRVGTAIFGAR